jgi:hypothetical protein
MNSSKTWWQTEFTPSLPTFIHAAYLNLEAAKKFNFWVNSNVEPGSANPVGLSPADPYFVDFVATIQKALGLPVTGIVDKATWEGFTRHVAASTLLGKKIAHVVLVSWDARSLANRVVGKPRGTWNVQASMKDVEIARKEERNLYPFPPIAMSRTTVVPLGIDSRTRSSTNMFGIPFWRALNASLWHTFVSSLKPEQKGFYVPEKRRKPQIGWRLVLENADRIYVPGDFRIPLIIAKYQFMVGLPVTGVLDETVLYAMIGERAAGTTWGKRLSMLFDFTESYKVLPPPRGAPSTKQEAIQRAARYGITTDGVVSVLNPKLIRDQASNTDALRKETQARRSQYEEASAQAIQGSGYSAANVQEVADTIARTERTEVSSTAGREGFVPQSEALAESNPVFDEGRGLVIVADGGATPDSPSSAPINEGSSITPVSDAVAQGQVQPAPAAPAAPAEPVVETPIALTPDEILPADVPLTLNTNKGKGKGSNKGLILLVAAGVFVYFVARRRD